MLLAVKTGAVATPLAFVVAVLTPPAKVPLGPFPGAAKVTVTALTGLLAASRTVTCNPVANAVLIVAFCGVPAVAVTLAGGPVTVKLIPLLATPPTFTTTFPVVAPAGTGITIVVAFQLVAVPAGVPLNVTVLVPCGLPKFVPLIVTAAPTCADVGLRVVMVGVVLLPAARKATNCMIHRAEGVIGAVAV